MLTRKPRIGELLNYDPTPAGKIMDVTVKRFIDNEPNIMVVNKPDGESDLILWKFSDGLNQLLSHKD
jgi:hypothetical protein